jgi:hypothetical protein
MYIPETQLYVEIISQAMRDALGLSGDPQYNQFVKSQARAWFDENDPDFQYVCHLMGMEPKRVINTLKKFAKEKKNFVRNFRIDPKN